MKKFLLLLLCLYGSVCFAQNISPDWYILERGCTVGVIKPGVNDLTLYLASTGNKPLDKTGIAAIEKSINFSPGCAVLIYAKYDKYYIATDIEGRNLVVKGGITKVERGEGSGVAFLKEDIKTTSGITLAKGSFVWLKEHKTGNPNAVIQGAGKQDTQAAFSKIYDINATVIDMAKNVKFKTVL